MTNEERISVIESYIKEFPDLSYWFIAKKIAEDFPDEYGTTQKFESLRHACRRYFQSNKKIGNEIVSISENKEKSKYQVIGDNYYWEANHGVIDLPVELIDELFYEYSEHGLNLSQTEIINKHNLQVWQWNSIKSTLWLFKKSNIFSPHTVKNTPKDQLAAMIADKIGKMLDNAGYQVEKQYNQQLNKKYKNAIKEQALAEVTFQTMVLEISDLIPKCDIKPYIRVKEDAKGILNVFIFDIHFGAQSRTTHTVQYSPEIVREILFHIAEVINAYKAKEINVFFGGDMIETFTGLNHIDSWKGIAKGMYGAKVIVELYKLLVAFLSQINNLKTIFAVPGNHDRASEKKEVDSEGSMAEILFELVKLSFENKVQVKYDEKIISESIDGVHYLMTHGHFKLSDITPAELILKYGDPNKFNLLMSGHWHERRIKKDHEAFRQVVCPSLFPGNDYSVNLGYTTAQGFIVAKSNGYNNKPIIIDHSI